MLNKPAPGTNPVITISRRGATRLKDGHVWVYRSDIVSAEGVSPGALVTVADERGKALGTALYSSASQIAIRMISPHPVRDLGALLRERIRAAIAYRGKVVRNSDAYRVVFSEGDFLPGLMVDRYNDLLAVQFLTQAMDAETVRQTVVSELAEQLKPAAMAEHVEPWTRELEQLAPREPALLQGEKRETVFTMNGVKFRYEVLAGQKTGAFLDQRENYAAAAEYARGEAAGRFLLSGRVCPAPGGAMLAGDGVDSSRPALEVAERNAALNGREIEWVEANAFDLLRDYAAEGRQL